MKKILSILVLLIVLSSAVAAGDWSSWEYLQEYRGVELYFKYKFSSDMTQVKWKLVNTTGTRYELASVVDKVYRMQDGSTQYPSSEGGTLPGYDEEIFISDHISGIVSEVSAGIKLRE